MVTADLPDEARLALLDLDVTADDVCGKELRWDTASNTWTVRQDADSSGWIDGGYYANRDTSTPTVRKDDRAAK